MGGETCSRPVSSISVLFVHRRRCFDFVHSDALEGDIRILRCPGLETTKDLSRPKRSFLSRWKIAVDWIVEWKLEADADLVPIRPKSFFTSCGGFAFLPGRKLGFLGDARSDAWLEAWLKRLGI